MNYVLVGLVAVSLLAGLIAIGVGNRGWSWGTVTAAILTLLMAGCYFVVASRLAAYEWAWTTFVRGKQVALAEARDGLVPEKPGGRLVPAADTKPLDALAEERVRWQRAYDRIDSWRSRHWKGCSFRPPALGKEPANGTLVVNLSPPPADTAAATGDAGEPGAGTEPPSPEAASAAADAAKQKRGSPFDEGAIVYLFDERDANEGGRFLGALRVLTVTTDPAQDTCTLAVAATEPPDAYDQRVWDRDYDGCVTAFDDLPSDRWLAFSATSKDDDGGGVMPAPTRRSIDEVEKMIGAIDQTKAFAAEVERHEAEAIVDTEEWRRIRARLDAGELLPGQYWATLKLDKDIASFGERLADEDAKRELLAGTEADFDLQTAFALQEEGSGTIVRVFERRPLRDAGTRLYGGLVGPPARDGDAAAVPADGIAGLVAAARRQIDQLRDSVEQLRAAQASVRAEAEATARRKEAYVEDLRNWTRDAAEAERIATEFDTELRQAETRLAGVTRDVVAQGRTIREAIRALSTRIDAVAPPPERAAAAAAQ